MCLSNALWHGPSAVNWGLLRLLLLTFEEFNFFIYSSPLFNPYLLGALSPPTNSNQTWLISNFALDLTLFLPEPRCRSVYVQKNARGHRMFHCAADACATGRTGAALMLNTQQRVRGGHTPLHMWNVSAQVSLSFKQGFELKRLTTKHPFTKTYLAWMWTSLLYVINAGKNMTENVQE